MKRILTGLAAALAAGLLSTAGVAPAETTGAITFPGAGPLSGPMAHGTFQFGVSSAATQIEDHDTNTDWYHWTAPKPGGLGKSAFVGDAVDGYTMALKDVALLKQMHLDSYRFSIEWARVEPRRGVIDEAALRHYGQLIDTLLANHIRPVITVEHFSLPTWVDNPDDPTCRSGPTDTNLCGLDNPAGGPIVVREMAGFARLLAARFGNRVHDWVTINEPMVYMMFSHAFGAGPPGKAELATAFDSRFVPALRNLIEAHVAMYRAIKSVDPRASVGLTMSAKQYVPVRDGKISNNPADVAAANRFSWFFERSFVQSLWQGAFDPKLDGAMTEQHPQWRGTLDWLGVQLYDRTGVSAPGPAPDQNTVPVINVDNCAGPPCLPLLDPSYWVPAMQYEENPQGLGPVLTDYGRWYPGLPLVVTENGIATDSGQRRSQIIVRALQQIAKVRAAGVDVRGYYHWSLLDNFEWLQGYAPHFGLYAVNRTTMARTPTSAAGVYGDIARTRSLSPAAQQEYGGAGPLAPEPAGR